MKINLLKKISINIPDEVLGVAKTLADAGFQVYLVGGCVRNILMKRRPKDWDLATNAKPEQVQKLFPDSVYENVFGTVAVKATRGLAQTGTQNDADEDQRESILHSRKSAVELVEVTTFRIEGKYTDKRRPEGITFAKTIEEDLSRRDFTMNAIAFGGQFDGNVKNVLNERQLGQAKRSNKQSDGTIRTVNIIDPYNGRKDIEDKVIRAVGNPHERFSEDALRLMRAVRLATELDFTIDDDTAVAMRGEAKGLGHIAQERIRDELTRILMADHAARGIEWLEEMGLLQYVIPELREGIGMTQNKHHIYTVFEHNVYSLEYAAKKQFSLKLRLASLLHDVGKSRTKRGEGPNATFYGHQVVGARMGKKILERLRFSADMIEDVSLLIREHMFVYDPEVVSLRGVRRLVSRVGSEHMDDLLKLREADRIGSGVPKAQPYRLRYLKAMIEKVKHDPIGPKMLKLDGNDIMKLLEITPGPKIGFILAILLEEVLDDPKENTKARLLKRAKELGNFSEKELMQQASEAKQFAAEAQERIDAEIKKKYFVK